MKLQRQKLNKTIEWESFSSSFFISCCYLLLLLVLALLQLHLNSHWFTHSIASHRIAGVRFGSHRIASHLISFALQRFVSLLRFALEARAGNGFSLIESKCCSDRMEMWGARWGQHEFAGVCQATLRMCNISNSFGNACQNRSVLKNGAR